MMEVVVRPLWRAFRPEQLKAAARHARDGGISVLKEERWRLLGDAGPRNEDLPKMVDWAIRAIEASRWAEITEGPLKGLVEAAITRGWRARVDEWIARDLAFDPTRSTSQQSYDCVKCAACCHDNKVVLEAADIQRFKDGGRADLLRRTSSKDGKRLLPLLRSKKKPCIHLDDSMCSIYEVRPTMCRDFPVGTEQCITSREDMYGEPFPTGR